MSGRSGEGLVSIESGHAIYDGLQFDRTGHGRFTVHALADGLFDARTESTVMCASGATRAQMRDWLGRTDVFVVPHVGMRHTTGMYVDVVTWVGEHSYSRRMDKPSSVILSGYPIAILQRSVRDGSAVILEPDRAMMNGTVGDHVPAPPAPALATSLARAPATPRGVIEVDAEKFQRLRNVVGPAADRMTNDQVLAEMANWMKLSDSSINAANAALRATLADSTRVHDALGDKDHELKTALTLVGSQELEIRDLRKQLERATKR